MSRFQKLDVNLDTVASMTVQLSRNCNRYVLFASGVFR